MIYYLDFGIWLLVIIWILGFGYWNLTEWIDNN